MQVDIVRAFINAAVEVLRQETGEPAEAGPVKLLSSSQTSEEVTVIIGVGGTLRGMVLLGMAERTALAIVSRMMGEPWQSFDELAQSGIAELGNVIAGRAGQGLEGAGHRVTISPPALVAGGPGMVISTVNIRRFVVPLRTGSGDIALHAAIEPAPVQLAANGHVAGPRTDG